MVITFLVEASLALYTYTKYRLSLKTKLIILLLINLSLFQFAEYFVCTNSTVAIQASRFGYAAITLLPPLGLHLMSELTKPMRKAAVLFMFGAAGSIVAYFLLSPSAFSGYQCTGNYVIFQIGTSEMRLYSLYYFGLIGLSLWKGARYLNTGKARNKKARAAVRWFMAGYMVFLIPVAVLVVFHPNTKRAVPSIMCGFAVSLAVILVAKVAPNTLKK